jgi:hypothetical protein
MGVLSLRFRGAHARRFSHPGFKGGATLTLVPPIPPIPRRGSGLRRCRDAEDDDVWCVSANSVCADARSDIGSNVYRISLAMKTGHLLARGEAMAVA